MKTTKFFPLCIVLMLTVFSSCKKNDESSTTTVDQDKSNIQSSFDGFIDNLQQIKSGTFYEAVVDFYGIKNDEATNQDWVDNIGDELGSVIDGEELFSDGRFNYSQLCNKYSWNINSETWSKTANATPLVLFPGSKSSTTNNCEFGFTAYKDKSVEINGDNDYLPTTAKLYLNKNNSKILSLDLEASYNTYGIPTTANVELFVSPATLKLSTSRITDSKYTLSLSLQNNENKNNSFSLSTDVVFSKEINSYEDVNGLKVNSINLTATQGELKISGSADIKSLLEIDENAGVTANDLNKYISATVYYKNSLTGTLKMKKVDGEFYVFIVYKDGSEENTSVYYKDFISDLESIFETPFDVKAVQSIIKKQIVKSKINHIKQNLLFWKN